AGAASYIGLVCYPPSPRAVTAARCAALCAGSPSEMRRVGLFVDADDDAIAAVLAQAPIDLLQLHGHETPERVAELRARFGRPVMKAIPVAAADDVQAAARYE